MKKTRFFSLILTAVMSIGMCFGLPVSAIEKTFPSDVVTYSVEVEDDQLVEQATKINEIETRQNGRIITTTTYQLKDGTIFQDVFERGDMAKMRSTSGSDTVTRKRNLSGVSMSMTADFKWYLVDHLYQMVECTNASGSYTTDNANIVKDNCTVSRPTSASKTSVKATTTYKFRNKLNPGSNFQGSFYIKCTSKGAISDNA